MFVFIHIYRARKAPYTSVVQTYLDQPLPFNRDIDLIRYFDKGGFDLTVLPNKTALWTRDIQLCIMFNIYIDSKNIGLLLSYYLHFFNHITVISGTESITKPYFAPDSVQVFYCDSYNGWYKHRCLRICLENPANESVEGFLFIADDMFVNITKMSQLDRTKLWIIPMVILNYTHLLDMSNDERPKNMAMVWVPEVR